MQKRIFVFLFAFLVAAPVFAADYIVKFKGNEALSLKSTQRMLVVDRHEAGQLVKVTIDDKNSARTVAELMKRPDVEYVVRDFKLHAFSAPVEAQALREQWAVAKVNAERAWSKAGHRGNRNVIVAVIDTGVDYRHESIKANAVPGYDFRDNDADPMDETGQANPGHGTHCAGIVGATGLVDNGIVGLSPEVSIMPIRFLGADGSGDLMGGIKSIDYAIEKGAKIISASWGATVGRSQAAPLIEAVKRADDAGVIFIAAAANDGRSNDRTDVFPANAGFPNMITVAASGSNDEKPSWSNYGRRMVHLAAPGLNIMSTLPKDKYGNLSGTSMATPLVSGLVALLAAQEPNITGAQARALLQTTGAKVSIETACNCRVDAGAAMDVIVDKKMFVAPAAGTFAKGDTVKMDVVNGSAPFTFTSSNPSAFTIAEDGTLSAVGEGEAVISVSDAAGKKATTLSLIAGSSSSQPPPGQPPGGGGECPLGDPAICEMICSIEPTLPWCTQ